MSVTVISKPNCPHCDGAKQLLASKSLSYDEVIIDVGQPKVDGQRYILAEDFKREHPEARTVPQVFIDGVRIGGFADLKRYLS